MWPAYVLGPAGVINPSPQQTSSIFMCIVATSEANQPNCTPQVSLPSPPAEPAYAASGPQSLDGLARTGLPVNPLWPIGLAILLIALGLTLVAATRRQQRKRTDT